jgi:hydrogenase maturation factor
MKKEISGKINSGQFTELLDKNFGAVRPEVLAGPGFGVDVSLVQLPGEMVMAITSDPLSLIPSLGLQESAWLSVQLMINDIATTGYAPMLAQFVLNLPDTLSKEDFKEYWKHVHLYCERAGVAITGGHTGFVEGMNSTISGGGTMMTIGDKRKIRLSKMAAEGDVILVTKSAAISSAAILAMSFPKTVQEHAGKATWQLACESFYQTSSLEDALIAVGAIDESETGNSTQNDSEDSGVTAMHDVTEGGILGAIYELVYASEKGAIIHKEKIPVGIVQQEVCNIFSLDPLRCIGAGSMIITCKKEFVTELISRMTASGINCTEVGVISRKEDGIQIVEKDETVDLVYYDTDPYWAAYFNAIKSGWR